MEGHLLHTFILNITAEMTGSELTVISVYHHLSSSCNHIASHVVKIRSCDTARTAHNNIVSRIYTVTAGSVRSEKIVPSVTPDDCSRFAIYGYIDRFVSFDTGTSLWIEFDDTDKAEICSICTPQASCNGIHKQAGIYGIAVFINLRRSHFNSLSVSEIRRLRIKSPVPHRKDTAGVTATKSSACRTICNQIAVTYLEGVGSCAATRAHSSRVPVPAVL